MVAHRSTSQANLHGLFDDVNSDGVLGDGTIGDLNQYVILDRLGRGSQGEVLQAMDTEANELRAIKVIQRVPRGVRVGRARRQQLEDLAREIAIMRRLRHRNVVALHEVIDDPKEDRLYLVMQYVESGPIANLSPDGAVSDTFTLAELAPIARQVSAGLQYLHRKGVVHRDLKPDNLLRDRDGTVYLSDFGVSELFEVGDAGSGVYGTRGTVAFMAPELFSASADAKTSPEAVDVWALGITFLALLTGHVPWRTTGETGSPLSSIPDQICAFDAAVAVPEQLQSASLTAEKDAAEADADDRSALFTGWSDLLVAMLQRQPQQRCTTATARQRILALDALAAALDDTPIPALQATDADAPFTDDANHGTGLTTRW